MSKNNINFFQNFDFFQMPISLSFKGNTTYKSNFGGILTIIGIICIIVLSIIGIGNLICKKDFSIISEEYEDLNESINLTNTPFAFILTDSKGHIFENDSKLFTIKIIQIKINNDSTSEEINIEFSKCKNYESNFMEIKNYNLVNYMCVNPEQNLLLKGRNNNLNEYQAIKIYINRCENETNNCYERSYIDKKLSNANFKFYYLRYYINHTENIINSNLYYNSVILSTNYIKKFSYIFQKVNYILYDSFSRESKNSLFIFKEYNIDIEDMTNDTSSLIGCLNFESNGHIIELSKILKNFWDILSHIGGIFNIVLGILKIIYKYVSKKILMFDMYENLDEIDSNNEKILRKIGRELFGNENKVNVLKNNSIKKRVGGNYFENRLNENSNIMVNKSSGLLNIYNDNNAMSPIHNNSGKPRYNSNNKINVRKFSSFKIRVETPVLKSIIPENQKIFIFFCPICISRKANFITFIFKSWDKIVQRVSIENFMKLNTLETLISKKRENSIRYNSKRNSMMVMKSQNNYFTQKNLQVK